MFLHCAPCLLEVPELLKRFLTEVTVQSESFALAAELPPMLASLVIALRSRSICECSATSVNGSYPAKSSMAEAAASAQAGIKVLPRLPRAPMSEHLIVPTPAPKPRLGYVDSMALITWA